MTAPGWYNAEGDPPGTTRYWDGDQWIGEPVTSPSGGVGGGYAPTGQKDGKLIAAGVLAIISAAVVGLIGIWFIVVASDDDSLFGFIDDELGNALTGIGIFFLFVAGLYLTAGVGSVQGKGWGRITNIVVQAIVLLLFVIGFIGALSDSGSDAAGSIIPVLWTGTILGLAITGKPWR